MKEFIAQSGAKVKIGMADFEDAINLKSAIVKELAKSDFNFGDLDLEDLQKMKLEMVSKILPALLCVDGSKEVYECLFSCLLRSTHNGEKINKQTFNDEQARGDFYQVALECLMENMRPFYQGVVSMLSGRKKKA